MPLTPRIKTTSKLTDELRHLDRREHGTVPLCPPVALPVFHFEHSDFLSLTMGNHGSLHRRPRNKRGTDPYIAFIISKEKNARKHNLVPFLFFLQIRYLELRTFVHLFLKACNIDDRVCHKPMDFRVVDCGLQPMESVFRSTKMPLPRNTVLLYRLRDLRYFFHLSPL